jgi:hypothetical protein
VEDFIMAKKELQKIRCTNCDVEIMEYYNEQYKGYRGTCPICKTDFPLD